SFKFLQSFYRTNNFIFVSFYFFNRPTVSPTLLETILMPPKHNNQARRSQNASGYNTRSQRDAASNGATNNTATLPHTLISPVDEITGSALVSETAKRVRISEPATQPGQVAVLPRPTVETVPTDMEVNLGHTGNIIGPAKNKPTSYSPKSSKTFACSSPTSGSSAADTERQLMRAAVQDALKPSRAVSPIKATPQHSDLAQTAVDDSIDASIHAPDSQKGKETPHIFKPVTSS